MLVKILGGIDVIAGVILMFSAGLSSLKELNVIFIFLGIILILKSFLGMLKDFGSWTDFLSGVVFILSAFVSVPAFIGVILGILLIQKGIVSFL